MFSSNKYVNRSFSVFSNNIQTTNCIASSIQTNNILDLTILGINNNNPRFTLDVNGNVNITGKLFKNGLPFTVGTGYWDLVGDSIINANTGSVIIDSWLNMTGNSYINFDTDTFGFKIQNDTSTPYTISTGEFATLRGINTDTTIQNQLTYINATSANISSDTTIGGKLSVSSNTKLSGYVGINSNPNITYNLNVGGTQNITGLLTANSIVLTSSNPSYTSNSVVPKSYVDTLASGIVLVKPCACATTESTDTSAWNYNGTSQFTGVSTSLIIDGYSVQDNNRVLVQNQSNQVQNGIYVYNQSGGTLTRSQDLAYGSDASNIVTFVQNGTVNKKTSFLQANYGAITGEDNLTFYALNTFDFGINDTLQLTGSTLGVNPTLTLTSLDTTGNTNIDGNLNVDGTSTLTGLLTANGGIITNSIQSPDPTTNINIGTTLTTGDINMGTTASAGQNVALNWGTSSNSGQLAFYGGSFNLISSGNYTQRCGVIYDMNIADSQTSGTLNIGTNAARTGVINIGNSSGTGSTGRTINIGGGGTGSFITNILGGVISVANAGTSFFYLNGSPGCGYLIGTTATSGSIQIGGTIGGTTTLAIGNGSSQTGAINMGTGASAKTITIGSAASTVNVNGAITVTGSLSTSGIVTATGGFVSGSDYRIKENITPLDSSFTVDELTPIRFTNKNTGKTDIGLIAHELQEFYPELVTGEKDGEQLQSINYQGLIGILIQEIKNLKQEVKELKEKVNM